MLTYTLFTQNHSIHAISIARELKKQTIEDHIVDAIKHNMEVDLEKIGLNKNIYKQIKKTINSEVINNNTSQLKPIKDLLPKTISYFHIKLSIVILEYNLEKDIFNSI